MAKPPKYKDFRVLNTVNVSSTGHYTFHVTFREIIFRKGETDYKPVKRYYDYGILSPLRREYPKYVLREIETLIAELLESGEAKFYENDRDGNRRYEGLRYHEPELIPHMIKCLREDWQ